MSDVLLLEHASTDAAFIMNVLKQVQPDVQIERVQDSQTVLDFVFCTGAYASHPAQNAPKLILLDVTHSVASGLEILRILKS
jgi:two-component system, response regulator